MKLETEMTLRTILGMDASISREDMERAMCLLRGEGRRTSDGPAVPDVMRMGEAQRFLGVAKRTLGYYIEHGFLNRVFSSAASKRAIGVTRESVLRFQARRIGRRQTT